MERKTGLGKPQLCRFPKRIPDVVFGLLAAGLPSFVRGSPISTADPDPAKSGLRPHKLAPAVFHGKGEGQEDQLGALGLVINIIILWNTLYINAAFDQLAGEGYPIQPEDVARLSPLVFDHINLRSATLSRFRILWCGQIRPLRNPPDAVENVA